MEFYRCYEAYQQNPVRLHEAKSHNIEKLSNRQGESLCRSILLTYIFEAKSLPLLVLIRAKSLSLPVLILCQVAIAPCSDPLPSYYRSLFSTKRTWSLETQSNQNGER